MALVWYFAWQMECCGTPFSVDDSVGWNLVEVTDVGWLEVALGADLAGQVTHEEDHHGLDGSAVVRKGRVRSIRSAYCFYGPAAGGDPRMLHPVRGTTELMQTQRVDGTERARSDLHFNGYLVELELASSCDPLGER